VELKRQGKDLFGRCPFHDDRTPSLSVSPETNLWHCLGACNSGGDVIAWVMKTRGVSFRHAVELLKNDHPSLAAGDGRVVRKGTTVKLASPVTADADDQQTLREVVSFYHQTLQESPEALRYLESRGLRHPEMTGHFQIGFANRKLGLTLPDKNRKAGEEMRTMVRAVLLAPFPVMRMCSGGGPQQSRARERHSEPLTARTAAIRE
jgi:DNA primase